MNVFLICSLFLLSSCLQPNTDEANDEYVLVEFASKLEEEYSKLEPDQNNPNHQP